MNRAFLFPHARPLRWSSPGAEERCPSHPVCHFLWASVPCRCKSVWLFIRDLEDKRLGCWYTRILGSSFWATALLLRAIALYDLATISRWIALLANGQYGIVSVLALMIKIAMTSCHFHRIVKFCSSLFPYAPMLKFLDKSNQSPTPSTDLIVTAEYQLSTTLPLSLGTSCCLFYPTNNMPAGIPNLLVGCIIRLFSPLPTVMALTVRWLI